MALSPGRTRPIVVGLLALAVGVVSWCSPGPAGATVGARDGATGRTATTSAPTRPAGCPSRSSVQAPSGPSASADTAQPASDGRPEIDLALYPRPKSAGNPWSQWGQGLVLDDGRFLSAIGNHLGKDGNAYLYVYDPQRSELSQFADVRTNAGDTLDWGYGKVHGQIVPGPCGDAYFATYWGTRTGMAYTAKYRGDLLFRIDPDALTIASKGVPVAGHGVPSLAGSTDGRVIYGEGVDPARSASLGRDAGSFFVYDALAGKTVFESDAADHVGFRNVLVDGKGNAYVAGGVGQLFRYSPGASGLVDAGLKLPGGGWLRASTRPGPDGTVYGVTTAPDHFFALRADGTVVDLGAAPGYTTSLALSPDGSRVYFVPGAHGEGVTDGAPLMALDTKSGGQTQVAGLDDLVRRQLGLRVAGSYDVVMDPSGSRLYVGLNAGTSTDEPWGEVVLAVVHLGEDRSGPSPTVAPKTSPDATTRPRKRTTGSAGAALAKCPSGGRLRAVYRAAAQGTVDPLRLDDVTTAWGLDAPLRGMMAHAVATGDVNGDGWTDLFVGTFADRPAAEYQLRGAAGPAPDRLLLGGPDGFRVDPSFPEELARTSGAAFGDLDGDGDPDLVVSRNVRPTSPGRAPTTVYRNDQGTFVKVTTLTEPAGGRSVGLLDYDADGRLDLFIAEDRFAGGSSVLLRNTGGFAFADATDAAGIPRGVPGMGVGTGDLNGDGRPDLFVGGANRLFLNQGGGRFTEQVGAVAKWATYGAEDDPAGVAEGDVNGDGRPDLVIGQHYNSTLDAGKRVPVRLYLNEVDERGNLRLRDVTDAAGLVGLPTKSPHVEIADLDADGRPDIVTTAAAADGKTPLVFRNTGTSSDGVPRFEASSAPGPAQYWVTGATFDADHDGRLDVVVAEWYPSLPTRALSSTGATGHWLGVDGAPGTTVELFAPGGLGDEAKRLASTTIGIATGYSAGPTDQAWFGLGDATRVDARITQPGGATIELRNLRADRVIACGA